MGETSEELVFQPATTEATAHHSNDWLRSAPEQGTNRAKILPKGTFTYEYYATRVRIFT